MGRPSSSAMSSGSLARTLTAYSPGFLSCSRCHRATQLFLLLTTPTNLRGLVQMYKGIQRESITL